MLVERLAAGAPASATPVTDESFAALWERYAKTLPAERWVKHTRSLMVAPLRAFGEMRAADMRPFVWTDYRDEVRKAQVSVSTRNAELKRIKAMYTWAVADGRMTVNPLDAVKVEPKRPQRETEISDEGLRSLLAFTGHLMTAFVLTAIGSGMRHNEVRNLKWSMIDLERRRVSLSWTGTKSKKSRHPRISVAAVEALRTLPRLHGCDYVFVNPETREPFSQTWIYEAWREAIRRAGVEAAPGDGNVHIHDARHTYASKLARAGAKITVIQRLLGHASLSSVERYLHVDETELDEAHELLQQRRPPRRRSEAIARESESAATAG